MNPNFAGVGTDYLNKNNTTGSTPVINNANIQAQDAALQNIANMNPEAADKAMDILGYSKTPVVNPNFSGITQDGSYAVSNISNPVNASNINLNISNNTPTLPTPKAPTIIDQNQTALTSNIQNTKTALDAEVKKREADYQKQIDALNKQNQDLQLLQNEGMADNFDVVQKESAAKQEALDLEKQRFDENYNANQTLVGELDGLLTTGNKIIDDIKKSVGGTVAFQDARISKTMTDIQARAGVIQTLMSARNGQMGQAQNQLTSTLNAVSSIYNDQIDYYKTLQDFYQTQKDDNGKKLVTLTQDQQKFLDFKVNSLEEDKNKLQATYDNIQKAMIDPDTALAYNQAGVTLNDSVEQINQKLATYGYAKEVKSTSEMMAKEGWTTISFPGAISTTTTDSKGVKKTWYKKGTAGGGTEPLSILDVARYNELYPEANVIAGDTETQANAKIAAINTPEAKTRSLITGAQSSGDSYETVINDINANPNLFPDKALALKTAKEVYGTGSESSPTPVYGTGVFSKIDINDRKAELEKIQGFTSGDVKAQLKKDGYPVSEVAKVAGNVIDKLAAFIFKE